MREDVIEGFRKAKETGKSCKTIEVVETELKAEPEAHSRGWHRSGAPRAELMRREMGSLLF